MAILPRLDDLIRLSPKAGHDANRVFNDYSGYIGFGKHHEE
jgi:hypothetical protein